MIEPVHKIKRYVVYGDGRPPHWTEDSVSGWLSSGILDKNGKEIFEGDKLKVFDDEFHAVSFEEGRFRVGKYSDLAVFPKANLEVIGHIVEEKL